MTNVRLRSFAKINLDLRVLDLRPDGYHNLRTIFQTISLADTIDIAYAPARRLHIEIKANINVPGGNLIEKAAQLLGISGSYRIRLTKRIPMGGGLGGGSSNAAATLLAIPALAGKQVRLDRLIEYAAQLGSDVPFFLLGGTATGLGRGTELYPLPEIARLPAVVVTPPIHVSTAAAYRALDAHRSAAAMPPTAYEALTWALDSPPGSWPCCNDFESVVFPQHPHLKSIKGKLLKTGADLALMSGSGSTLFGLFANHERRNAAVASLRKDLGKEVIFPVSLVSRNAYRSLWRRQLRLSSDLKTWPPQSRYAR
jgi:4-diphosphocytidyl-2-C-methyl-D-erythritol kinase